MSCVDDVFVIKSIRFSSKHLRITSKRGLSRVGKKTVGVPKLSNWSRDICSPFALQAVRIAAKKAHDPAKDTSEPGIVVDARLSSTQWHKGMS